MKAAEKNEGWCDFLETCDFGVCSGKGGFFCSFGVEISQESV